MGWLAFLPLIFLVAMAWVFYPLLVRARPLPAVDPAAPVTLRRDLLLREIKELDYETEIGLVPAEEAARARDTLLDEAARVLSRLEKEQPAAPAPDAVENRGLTLFAMLFLVLVLAVGSSGLYIALGVPVPPPQPTAAPRDHALEQMVQTLGERMKREPDNVEGWMQLGRSFAYLNRPRDAMAAFGQALTRDANNLEAAAGLAEAQLATEDPQYIAKGFSLFEKILEKAPDHPQALWYAGQGSLRSGDTVTALARFRKLLPLLPAGSDSHRTVSAAIAEVEQRGP